MLSWPLVENDETSVDVNDIKPVMIAVETASIDMEDGPTSLLSEVITTVPRVDVPSAMAPTSCVFMLVAISCEVASPAVMAPRVTVWGAPASTVIIKVWSSRTDASQSAASLEVE